MEFEYLILKNLIGWFGLNLRKFIIDTPEQIPLSMRCLLTTSFLE